MVKRGRPQITEKRVKTSLHMPVIILDKIKKIAKKEDRSFNYMANKLFEEALELRSINQSGDK